MALNQAKRIVDLNPSAQRQIAAATKADRAATMQKALNMSMAAFIRT